MARLPDIADGLGKQLKADAEEIRKLNDELNKHRAAYQRYREVSSYLDSKADRIKVTLGLLFHLDGWNDEDGAVEFCEELGIAIDEPTAVRVKNPLWKSIREVLRQVTEMQIVELESILHGLGVNTSRQAIESAVDTHKDAFRVTRRGREKFVSLK